MKIESYTTAPVIDGYDIFCPVGAGEMASLWLAYQVDNRRRVIIKFFNAKLNCGPEDVIFFNTQAKKVAALQHPNLIPVIDYGFTQGRYYFVTEYYSGETLDNFVSQNLPFCDETSPFMPEGIVLGLAQQTAEALHYAYTQNNIVHGNLKPENLIWTRDRIKLMDIGVLYAVGLGQSQHNRTLDTMVLGTPSYMAPEQIQGMQTDCRMDIYSFGLTLYFLLTGHVPFEGSDGCEVTQRQITDYIMDPREFNPAISENMVLCIANMTGKNPAHRPANWETVLAQFKTMQQNDSLAELFKKLKSSTIRLNLSYTATSALTPIPSDGKDEPQEAASVSAATSNDYMACPFCAELVRKKARICRFCNRTIPRKLVPIAKAKASYSPGTGAYTMTAARPIAVSPHRKPHAWPNYVRLILSFALIGLLIFYTYMKFVRHIDIFHLFRQAVAEHVAGSEIRETVETKSERPAPDTSDSSESDGITAPAQPEIVAAVPPAAQSPAATIISPNGIKSAATDAPPENAASDTATTTATGVPSDQQETKEALGSEKPAQASVPDTPELEDAKTQYNLALSFANGINGVEKNDQQAFVCFTKAAEGGLPEAQYYLAFAYLNGTGTQKDLKKSLAWFRKAAERGLPEAQFQMAGFYATGHGVASNATQAVQWYQKAALQGLVEAQYNMGLCYEQGLGVPCNLTEAVKWYRKVAEKDILEAQLNLGICYAKLKNYKEALYWLAKAEQQGSAKAKTSLLEVKFTLGLNNLNGYGTPLNAKEAAGWFKQAAEGRHSNAQYNLGLMYFTGNGVPQDVVKAWDLMQQSAETGNAQAKQWLTRMKQFQPVNKPSSTKR